MDAGTMSNRGGLRYDQALCVFPERGESVSDLRPELELNGEAGVEVEAVQQIRSAKDKFVNDGHRQAALDRLNAAIVSRSCRRWSQTISQ